VGGKKETKESRNRKEEFCCQSREERGLNLPKKRFLCLLEGLSFLILCIYQRSFFKKNSF
jgi:hypothetical protein